MPTNAAANALRPIVRSHWLPPMRFRLRPFLELSRSFSEALADLEEKYARPHVLTQQERDHILLQRRPR